MSEHFESWVVLELMGHRKLGGFLREASLAGGSFLRIDIPRKTGEVTQFYPPGAVYCITPCSEETARSLQAFDEPIHRWELPPAPEIGGAKSETAISTIDDFDEPEDPTLEDPNMDETYDLGRDEDLGELVGDGIGDTAGDGEDPHDTP